jgi:hypothetical protein
MVHLFVHRARMRGAESVELPRLRNDMRNKARRARPHSASDGSADARGMADNARRKFRPTKTINSKTLCRKLKRK